MTNPRLFSTGRGGRKTFWYVDENPICGVCGGPITDHTAGVVYDWTRDYECVETLFHTGCASDFKSHPLSVMQYRWPVVLSHVIPPKSAPVLIPRPNTTPVRGDVSVFEPRKVRSRSTSDEAWRSKRFPSVEGAMVGDVDALERAEARDREVEADPDAFLLEMQVGGRRVIAEDEKKQVGNGDGGVGE